jgi:hypothetical protein
MTELAVGRASPGRSVRTLDLTSPRLPPGDSHGRPSTGPSLFGETPACSVGIRLTRVDARAGGGHRPRHPATETGSEIRGGHAQCAG